MCKLEQIKFLVELGADLMFVNDEHENAIQIVEHTGARCSDVLAFLKETQAVRDRDGEL